MKVIELSLTILAVAIETRADAFPVAGTHGEGFADGYERLTVGAV